MTCRIAVIGGGATGLSAAWTLRRAQESGLDIQFDLYERDQRLGGKVAGEVVEGPEGRFVIDGGPDCISAHKPAGRRAARMLGLEENWLPSNEPRKRVYIYRGGRPRIHHPGFSMFVPTDLVSIFETEVLTDEGRDELLREMTRPAKKVVSGQSHDESLESFIVRRFGREVLDYLAEPFIGGVHASDPKDMSLAATFPMYLDMEQTYGSVIKATVLARAARERAAAGKTKDPRDTVFATFTGGLHQLTDAMAAAAGRACLHTGVEVTGIERVGNQYRLHFSVGTPFDLSFSGNDTCMSSPRKRGSTPRGGANEQYDAVIIATESFAAASLTAGIDAAISHAYAHIPNLSSATASFAFRAADAELRYDGFGVLVPEVEKRNLLAATFSSTKWVGRAPKGYVLLRGFAGTPQNQAVMDNDDETLTAIILDELRQVMGLSERARPVLSRLWRWTQGMSQYTMGHLDWIETIEARAAATVGLACAGGCFRGVGVPNCIAGGEAAARKVLVDMACEYKGE
jgi:oxygen-dependent protoporphyrinogen oxidase